MREVNDRVKIIADGVFKGEIGTVKRVFPADHFCPVDGYGVLLDSDDDPNEAPMYFDHFELEGENA